MNVSIGKRWERFVEAVVARGRYNSSSEVVREGLRLVEEREVRLEELRRTISASIAEGGDNSDEEVESFIVSGLGSPNGKETDR